MFQTLSQIETVPLETVISQVSDTCTHMDKIKKSIMSCKHDKTIPAVKMSHGMGLKNMYRRLTVSLFCIFPVAGESSDVDSIAFNTFPQRIETS